MKKVIIAGLMTVMFGLISFESSAIKVKVEVNRSSRNFCWSDGTGCKITVTIGKLSPEKRELEASMDKLGADDDGHFFDGFVIPADSEAKTEEIKVPGQVLNWDKEKQVFIFKY